MVRLSRKQVLRALSKRSAPQMATPNPAPRPNRATGALGNVVRLPLPDSDAALAACLRSNPEHGQALLFDRFCGDVERILLRILGPDPEITDLLHEVFIVALTSIDSLRDANALRGWLAGIAVHQARRLIRRRKIRRLVQFVAPSKLCDHKSVLPTVEASHALRETYRLLEKLPADDRIAFTLKQIEGMELSAIAQTTHVSLATVKRRVSRAQRRFVAMASENEILVEWLDRGTLQR
jgi:RNA polymerase sigma-70 factor (ECF subfamily)